MISCREFVTDAPFRKIQLFISVTPSTLGMLDDYCQIAREIARKYEVPYLDIRGELKKAVPWWRLWYSGYVTKDGEHTNERGTQLLAKMIAEQLLQWFETYNSTTHFINYITPTSPQLSYILDDQTY